MPLTVTRVTAWTVRLRQIASMSKPQTQPKSPQFGLTVVELLVVAATFTALAAVALPRFAALDESSRIEAVADLAAEIRAQSAMSFAIWMSANGPDTLVHNEQPMLLVNGYPSAADMRELVVGDALFEYDGGRYYYSDRGTPVADCHVTYIPPARVNYEPAIEVEISGC